MALGATASLRLVVCGGRVNRAGWSALCVVLSGIQREHGGIAAIIQGGARGVDEDARAWGQHHGIPVETYPADWQTHGRAAGPIRNGVMLAESRPDAVLAFPGGPGTADCVRQARALGLPVWEPYA
jgi:hypothetical protein